MSTTKGLYRQLHTLKRYKLTCHLSLLLHQGLPDKKAGIM